MLTLLLGKDWKANRAEILRRISEDVENRRPGRILIVPELISHDTERRVCQAAGDTASRYVQVLSFTRLARRVCDIVGNVECMDNGGRLVAMASAARQLHSRLKAYAAVETKPEFLVELVEAVDEFKRCCISSDALQEAAARTEGSLAQKLEELSLLLESYDSLCSRGKRDPRDQMTWVLEQLEEIDFAQEHVFYIDGFPDFTRQHMAVLEHLVKHAAQVVVSLNCDCVGSGLLAFEKAGQTASELVNIARRWGVRTEACYIPAPDTPLQTLCDGLFQGKAEPDADLAGKVRLLRANSVYQQCQIAARRVLELLHGGCRCRDIGLVCTDMAAYTPALKLVFGQAGIPLYLSGTEDVLQTGAVATVVAALDAALGGFEQRQVLRYLRSSLSPLDAHACDLVENYALTWRISGRTWKEPWKNHPQGLSGRWDDRSREELEQLNEARSLAIDPLMHLEAAFKRAKNMRQQVCAVYDLWEETELARRIEALADSLDAAGDNRSAQLLDQLWEILLTALEQLHDVLGETVWEPEHFTKLFKLLLSQYDVGAIPPVLDAVSVGSVSAQRCQQQKHLLVLGAEEGSLPGYGGAAGLLSDQERVQLRMLGLPLTGGAVEGLQAEFAEIYGVFCGAEESVTVLCGQQPSFLFRRLEKMAGEAPFAEISDAAIITDRKRAGSFLARWEDDRSAQTLDVLESYQDTCRRKRHSLGMVSPENIRALYGRTLQLSASQVDKQAVCRLAYFLQYGLRAKECRQAEVDPAEFGTYVHAVLEKTVSEVMTLGGFAKVSLDTTLAVARRHSDAYIEEHFGALESQRLQYLLRRNAQELELVIRELWRELSQAEYAPQATELRFGFDGQMPAISIPGAAIPARLGGTVDRVDTWQKNGATYFRVVDYKTGKKGFDYCDILSGVGLQLLLYLFALEDSGELGGRGVPAGVQYFPARAPYIQADSDLTAEEAEKERRKLWKRQGLLLEDMESLRAMDPQLETLSCKQKKDGTLEGDLADRAQLGTLKEYVMALLRDMVDQIASGCVTPNPYSRGTSFDACTYCPYGAICRGNGQLQRRAYQTVPAQRFWQEVEKEEKAHGQ